MNPRGANFPNFDPDLHPAASPETSLVEDLGAIVDDVRQIATDVGARPYRVFAVTYRWTGGEIGRGTCEIASEVEFLPTPRESSLTAFRKQVLAGGTVERGTMTLTEISPRYTEDEIDVLCYGARSCRGPGFQTFIEMSIDRRDGDRTKRRRLSVSAAPYRDTDALCWRVDLVRQDADRAPDGAPTVPFDRDPFRMSR